jgi:hypothetical protein
VKKLAAVFIVISNIVGVVGAQSVIQPVLEKHEFRRSVADNVSKGAILSAFFGTVYYFIAEDSNSGSASVGLTAGVAGVVGFIGGIVVSNRASEHIERLTFAA